MSKDFHFFNPNEELSMWAMGFFGILVGIIAGFGAVAFRAAIAFIHNLFFLGKLSLVYDANVHTPDSPWGLGIIFVPVIGAIIVTWLVKNFAPEAKGHGVPEVIDAVYFNKGKIRPVVALIKAIASSISIGTGGSVGREGPIVQIGSAFGSTLGQFTKLNAKQKNILIAAGAAGGIAATFNTPLGGLTFAIELLLVSITASSVFPVAIATVTACFIGRTYIEVEPAFYIPSLIIPSFEKISLSPLLIFIPFGILIGLCSIVFIKGLYLSEDFFEDKFKNSYIRHISGMFLLGILMYILMETCGNYFIQGVGYATIEDILKGLLTSPLLLLSIAVLKLLATFLTLGSGASGGIFSPSLFLGATFGSSIGIFLDYLFPGLNISPVAFAIAGMAGMICSVTGAVVTSIIMLTELVHNMNFALPIIVTVAASYAVRKLLCADSIYTLKLSRRGEIVPEGLQAAVTTSIKANNIMSKSIEFVDINDLRKDPVKFLGDKAEYTENFVIVKQEEDILGILSNIKEFDSSEDFMPENYIDKNLIIFPINAKLPDIMHQMHEEGLSYGLISCRQGSYKASNIVGVVTKEELYKASAHSTSLL